MVRGRDTEVYVAEHPGSSHVLVREDVDRVLVVRVRCLLQAAAQDDVVVLSHLGAGPADVPRLVDGNGETVVDEQLLRSYRGRRLDLS